MVASHQEEFKAANGHIVIVSFGNLSGAKKWLEQTQCPFPMFIDNNRQLYKSLGLKRSVSKVWNTSTLIYYAEEKKKGRPLIGIFEEDDPTQMGGDFIVDSQGNMKLVYRSKVANDRPTVKELLQALES
ncbi:uncharacterized protein LOC110252835 [Exaiptasia diaphana]|uniref:Alkyl hydroperoxide reductase subunit C/ Thiol specific antioxidant domain-containing protein n=1 Tax=Exaiptasia diaphana TaxID=2652724 RepID=A0A913Y713_EXADI|nr:uncharacterized protein LOC110252835 [Exaiptasia diaphana]